MTCSHTCLHTPVVGRPWGQCHPEPNWQLCLRLIVRFSELFPLWSHHHFLKLPVELGTVKASGFSHFSVSFKLYLWVPHRALTILQWLQFCPEILYINNGLAQGSVLSSLLSFFHIFPKSSHSPVWSYQFFLLQRSDDYPLLTRHLCLHLSPTSPNRCTLLAMPSCLAKQTLPCASRAHFCFPALSTPSCLSPSHLWWTNF